MSKKEIIKLIKTGTMIFESSTAYWNYKKSHPEYVNKFWEENTKPKNHWWEIWR